MTPGQAAYTVVAQRDDSLWHPWPELSEEGRAIWEAAAQAAIAAAEADDDTRSALQRAAREVAVLAIAEAERDEARAVAAEMLDHIVSGDDYADPAKIAKWRARAGLEG